MTLSPDATDRAILRLLARDYAYVPAVLWELGQAAAETGAGVRDV